MKEPNAGIFLCGTFRKWVEHPEIFFWYKTYVEYTQIPRMPSFGPSALKGTSSGWPPALRVWDTSARKRGEGPTRAQEPKCAQQSTYPLVGVS
jgi:hypothetical protein